ncbi:MAG: hypothetical protein ABIP93_13475, partial [Gemmatimonadaceae bacterium]
PNAAVGRVEVEGRCDGEIVTITVRDNGPRLADASSLAGEGGVGLRNTRARLAQLYGAEHTLSLAPGIEGGVVATLTLPYHTRADLRVTTVEMPVPTAELAAVSAAARG